MGLFDFFGGGDKCPRCHGKGRFYPKFGGASDDGEACTACYGSGLTESGRQKEVSRRDARSGPCPEGGNHHFRVEKSGSDYEGNWCIYKCTKCGKYE